MSISYTATSLADIADAIERMADDEAAWAERVPTQRRSENMLHRAAAFREAARMVRATTLIGVS